jgi:hypothetical protein
MKNIPKPSGGNSIEEIIPQMRDEKIFTPFFRQSQNTNINIAASKIMILPFMMFLNSCHEINRPTAISILGLKHT